MEQSGEYEIPASRDAVWTALNDPEILGRCITGCQDVVQIDEHHFEVKVKAKVGPVSATFQAELELQDLDPPNSYTIKGGVKGGAAGFGKGDAHVKLTELEADSTRLTYQVKASVGGKLAQVGSRLVDGAARKMADEFFAAFRAHLVGPEEVADDTSDTGPINAAQAGQAPQQQSQGSSPAANQPAEENTETATSEGRYESSGGNLIWIIAFVVLGLAILLAV